jgi:hypothetical protein
MSKYYVTKPDLHVSHRAAKHMRLLAKAIDFSIAFTLIFIFGTYGIFFAMIFLSIIDAANLGQSVGKKILGFKVLLQEDKTPCSIKASAIRNLPLTFPFVFLIIPFWGIFIFLLTFGPICLLEVYYISRLDTFHRLGDVLADTTVVANDPREKWKNKSDSWLNPIPIV